MQKGSRKCNAEGKYTGTLDFEFEGDASLIDIPFVSFSTPVHAVLDYEIFEDNSVEVKGELSFTLEGACSRCLKPTKEHVLTEAEALFVPQGGKAEEEDYTYRNGIVDLGEFLRDTVLFALPSALFCAEGCSAPEYNEE